MLRTGWIGHIEHRPAPMPEMAHIKVPSTIHFLHGQLEGRPTVQVMKPNMLDVV